MKGRLMSETFAIGDGRTNNPGEMLSPGLAVVNGRAFEFKFRLSCTEADGIEAWARQVLSPDAHGDNGCYAVASLYCDTAERDVFRRSPGFKRSKFRVRQYGESESVFLERKSKKGDCVRKKRVEILRDQLSWLEKTDPIEGWAGIWFRERIHQRALLPTCRVSYRRTAFLGLVEGSPVRLTIDRELFGAPVQGWDAFPPVASLPLLPGEALLELKFHTTMPTLFRDLLPRLPVQTARVSKFRRCIELCGLAPSSETFPTSPVSPS